MAQTFGYGANVPGQENMEGGTPVREQGAPSLLGAAINKVVGYVTGGKGEDPISQDEQKRIDADWNVSCT